MWDFCLGDKQAEISLRQPNRPILTAPRKAMSHVGNVRQKQWKPWAYSCLLLHEKESRLLQDFTRLLLTAWRENSPVQRDSSPRCHPTILCVLPSLLFSLAVTSPHTSLLWNTRPSSLPGLQLATQDETLWSMKARHSQAEKLLLTELGTNSCFSHSIPCCARRRKLEENKGTTTGESC